MADTRTFDPSVPDPIAAAIRAAMGEPIRPRQPGTPAPSPVTPSPVAPKPSVGPLSSLGTVTFVAAPAPKSAARDRQNDDDAAD